MILLLFASMTFSTPKTPAREQPLKEKLMHLDLLGTAIWALCLISLLLALQYGVQRPWNDTTIIVLFCVSGASLPVFLFQQFKRTRQGLFPLRIIRRRNVWAACGLLSFLFATLGAIFYYLPLFFQVIIDFRSLGFPWLTILGGARSFRPAKWVPHHRIRCFLRPWCGHSRSGDDPAATHQSTSDRRIVDFLDLHGTFHHVQSG